MRRLKEDMKRFDGTDIFPPRHVHSVTFRLTEAERHLYNGVTNYVRNYFDRARENRSISFALMILQRRLIQQPGHLPVAAAPQGTAAKLAGTTRADSP